MDDKLAGVMRKIEALLNTNGCSEAEAQSRLAKAQELLERYNLDMAEIGKSGKGQQRADTKKTGGLYGWQRSLWKAVAELNFCHYISIKGLARGSVYEHRLIGSHGNVVATEVMARYLQETIERLAQSWSKGMGHRSVFVREAIAYREGMAARLSERLRERREVIVQEQRRKDEEAKRERERTKADPGTTALTILDVISTEADLNNDYLYNYEPGTTARKRKADEEWRAKYWADYQAKMKAQREWDEANPEAAAARKKKEREDLEKLLAAEEKRNARRAPPKERYRALTPEEQRARMGSYYEGRSKGDEVGIDQQVDGQNTRKIA